MNKKIIALLGVLAVLSTLGVCFAVSPSDMLGNKYYQNHFIVEQYLLEDEAAVKFQPQMEAWLYQQNHVNETGKIMIVMYHRLGNDNSSYTRKVEDFKNDLQRLYDEGYTLVSMSEYINGTFDVPMGRTPVILTFDDGHLSNFNYTDTTQGTVIDPECAVGIIDAFYELHPDFGRHAIFYLNKDNPFGQPEYLSVKLSYLYNNGYEIGNHTMHHISLNELDANGIQRAIGGNVNYYEEIDSKYIMTSLALPNGLRPKDDTLRKYIFEGEYQGQTYQNILVLLVGWRPENPLYLMDETSYTLNRVQSGDGEYQLSWWLDYFDSHPSERFYSDGIPERVSVPQSYDGEISVTPYLIPEFRMGG